MENLKIEDLIEGEIYHTINPSYNKYIFKSRESKTSKYSDRLISDGSFNKNDYFGTGGVIEKNLRLATSEEKHWLNCCIAKNQFIPYTKAMETFNQQNTQQYEVGKWYKYTSPHLKKNCWYVKYSNLQPVSDRFYYDEVICLNKDAASHKFGHTKKHDYSIFSCNPVLLTDLEVIQQYLPEGHVDKIPTNMFKKDDYIVVLQKPNGCLDYLPPNFCFKQYQNYETLFAEKAIDKTVTSCSDVTFLNKFTWRYATKEEISEYNRIGEPFDVTTLNKKSYKYEVVHCKTQEEWNFVREKTTKINSQEWEQAIKQYSEGIALVSDGSSWCGLNYFKQFNTLIYSFEEWCNKFGHIPDFKNKTEEIPEYVECVKRFASETLGKIRKRSELPEWVRGHSFEQFWKDYGHHYKPSTKEAYEAQFLLGNNWIKNAKIVHQSYPVTPEECFNNEIFKIGDSITTNTWNNNFYPVTKIGLNGEFWIKYENEDFKYNISYFKWITKANNTTTHVNKKVDISSPIQVGNEVTNITIPKSASVVLKNTENEVKIKINLKQTIKL